MQQMTVYRASAGSGKTFTLAVKYIELLMQNPLAYKSTLAVTFTNKATEEMKHRILSQLYGLANALDDSEDYMEVLMRNTGLGRVQIKKRAAQALQFITHDYHYFCVETIDAFFQRVLRNLARELDLTANLRVELNSVEMEQMAVDSLIAELDAGNKMLGWIVGYIDETITEEKNWNVISQIKEFGKDIFNESYRQKKNALEAVFSNEQFFKDYRHKLNELKKKANDVMLKYADKFDEILKENGLTSADFSRGDSGAAGYFKKLRDESKRTKKDDMWNATAKKAAESADAWVKAADRKPGKVNYDVADKYLVQLLNDAEHDRQNWMSVYKSVTETLKHLHELRLLNAISQKVRDICIENNQFLLCDTQSLLAGLMEDSDAPFVFEKIGSNLRHIMIDEFQDTSTVQWGNFRKLIAESMAHEESSNLIVGDVKQSIYRWRQGDWSLLANINDDECFRGKNLRLETLDTNFRSDRTIVNFNNEFFLRAAILESENLRQQGNEHWEIPQNIYNKELLVQAVPEKKVKSGYVCIDLLPKEDYKAEYTKQTAEHIRGLLNEGHDESSIAILMRSNEELRKMAQELSMLLPNVSFVSDEAFHLDASVAVNIIIAAMQLLVSPQDMLARAHLEKLNGANIPSELHDRRKTLLRMPLRDLSEELALMFGLEKYATEAAYVCALNDEIANFTRNNPPVLSEFLTLWEENISKRAVKGGDVQGVRLMTIHKSKGLEFSNLIIPSCTWKTHGKSTLWCTTDEKPFNELPVVPLSSLSIQDTVYDKDYQLEYMQDTMDNLNMLYVALTRASHNLFIISKNASESANNEGHLLVKTLRKLQQDMKEDDALREKLPDAVWDGDFADKSGSMRIEMGCMVKPSEKKERVSRNVFEQVPQKEQVALKSRTLEVEFKQSNQSIRFTEGEKEDEQQKKYIETGTLMHELLSRIKTLDDLGPALKDFEQEGVLYDGDMNREKLSALIRKRVEQGKVERWFSHNVEVYNECTILEWDETLGAVIDKRPDRVVKDGDRMTVIDFKFGRPQEEHMTQVRRYMRLLKDMGYENVDGCLWYIYTNKVVRL